MRERAGVARQHLRVADDQLSSCADGPSEAASVAASNAISAAIAAADAICGSVLGERSSTADHREATALLAKVTGGAELSRRLARLLAHKTQTQYGGYVTVKVARDSTASARRLVEALTRFGV